MKQLLVLLFVGLLLFAGCNERLARISSSRRHYTIPSKHHEYRYHSTARRHPPVPNRKPPVVVPHRPHRRPFMIKPPVSPHRPSTPHRRPVMKPHGPFRGRPTPTPHCDPLGGSRRHSSHGSGRSHK